MIYAAWNNSIEVRGDTIFVTHSCCNSSWPTLHFADVSRGVYSVFGDGYLAPFSLSSAARSLSRSLKVVNAQTYANEVKSLPLCYTCSPLPNTSHIHTSEVFCMKKLSFHQISMNKSKFFKVLLDRCTVHHYPFFIPADLEVMRRGGSGDGSEFLPFEMRKAPYVKKTLLR